jgi:hypothetical protein
MKIGHIYFFAGNMTSKTPFTRLERAIVPGTCGITNFDACNSGCRLVYVARVLPNRSRPGHVAESVLTFVICKHFCVDARGVTFAKVCGKLDFRMVRIIAPDKASDKPNNDRLPDCNVRHCTALSQASLSQSVSQRRGCCRIIAYDA